MTAAMRPVMPPPKTLYAAPPASSRRRALPPAAPPEPPAAVLDLRGVELCVVVEVHGGPRGFGGPDQRRGARPAPALGRPGTAVLVVHPTGCDARHSSSGVS